MRTPRTPRTPRTTPNTQPEPTSETAAAYKTEPTAEIMPRKLGTNATRSANKSIPETAVNV